MFKSFQVGYHSESIANHHCIKVLNSPKHALLSKSFEAVIMVHPASSTAACAASRVNSLCGRAPGLEKIRCKVTIPSRHLLQNKTKSGGMDPDAVWRSQGCFFQWIQAQSCWHGGGNSNAYLQVAESRVCNLQSHEKRKCDSAQIILFA